MSVYKEGYHAVELIQKRSTQIFSDACDYGAPTKEGDELWKWVKQAVEWYGIKSTRGAHLISDREKQIEIIISLMDEWRYSDDAEYGKRLNEDNYTEYFKITYFKTRMTRSLHPGNDGFFTVEKITDYNLRKEYKKAALAQLNAAA